MIGFIGRVAITAIGVTAIRAGSCFPWWGDVLLIVFGIGLINFADRDRHGG